MKKLQLPVRIPAPEGPHLAVVADVEAKDAVQTQFGVRDLLRLVFEIEATNPSNGKRLTVSRSFTASLHAKGALRPFLESLVGRALNDEKLRANGFDPESLIGHSCMVVLKHEQGKDGQTYSNIVGAYPLPQGTEPLTVKDYHRTAAA
jgi:hypothetical protein